MYVHFSKVSAIKQEGVNFGPSECTYIIANIHKHTVYIHTCTVYRLCIYIYTIYIYTHYIYIYICHPYIHTSIHPSIHPSIRTYVCTYIHYITLHCIALHCITLHYITYIHYIYIHIIYIYIYVSLEFSMIFKRVLSPCRCVESLGPCVLVFFCQSHGVYPKVWPFEWGNDMKWWSTAGFIDNGFCDSHKKTLNEWEWAMVF